MRTRLTLLTGLLLYSLALLVVLLCGCARFKTVQYDRRYNEDGTLATEIVTKGSAWTAFSSRQLAHWKMAQTEKTQGATVGLEQQGATNTLAVLEAINQIIRSAGAMAP